MLLNRLTCKKVSHLLWDFAAYRLPESDWESVERHLQTCARCRREMEQYRSAVRLVEAARSQPAPASQTTWHALRAQLESERIPAIGHVAGRRQTRGYAGLTLLGGLAAAAIAIALLRPATTLPPLEKTGSAPPTSSQPSDTASQVMAALSTAFAHPPQVNEVPVSQAASAPSTDGDDSPNSRLSYANDPQEITPRYASRSGWTHIRRGNNALHIMQRHRQEPQQTTPNLQYASSVDGNPTSDTAAQHYYVIDPLPSPADQPRHYVMDMVSLSTTTPTLASNVEGNKDQDIW
ncbi:MAG TPA: hypothetical protein VFA07_17885 [Chthonomonadaceae bacterium]|nr:hypothetical protein [Chthonomonadaceae bacterium]